MTDTDSPKKEIFYIQPPPNTDLDDDEINLAELWGVVWSAKWFVMGFPLVCTIIAVLVSLYALPVIYKSEATLQPTASSSSSMSMLSNLVGNLPIDLPAAGDDKSTGMMSFLQSRTLQERLIKKYDLLQRIYKDDWDVINKKWLVDDPEDVPTIVFAIQNEALKDIYSVEKDKKTNLISIFWSDEDPVFAKTMLEHVITELQSYLDKEYVSDAKRERIFVQGQLKKVTHELEYWESRIPSDTMRLSKITRERLATQVVYTELRKQLELAKINEAKELLTFKVLDQPFVPQKKDKPKRALICLLTLICSGFLAVFLVFFVRFIKDNSRQEDVKTETE